MVEFTKLGTLLVGFRLTVTKGPEDSGLGQIEGQNLILCRYFPVELCCGVTAKTYEY